MHKQSSIRALPDNLRISKLLAARTLTAIAIIMASAMVSGDALGLGQAAYASGVGTGNQGQGVGNTADLGNQGNDDANRRAAGGVPDGGNDGGDDNGGGDNGGGGIAGGGTAGVGTAGAGDSARNCERNEVRCDWLAELFATRHGVTRDFSSAN